MAPPEAAQEGPQSGRVLDYAAKSAGCSAGAQHVGVVYAVATGQGGGQQRHHLVARVGPARRISEVNMVVGEFTQTQTPSEGGRKEQPSIGNQPVVVEGDSDAAGLAGGLVGW